MASSAHVHRQRRAGASTERAATRLKRILTSNPRARHFTVRRIVRALGNEPQGSVTALFSAAGIFEAADMGYLSGAVTGAVGARMALRRQGVWLPRAVLRRKIPRQSLARVIYAVANVLEVAEERLQARWDWVFHPAMGVVLGLLIFLLALAGMTPILGMGAHAGASFLISIGMAERDGLVVMIGALAGVASLAIAISTVFGANRLLHTTKEWFARCFKRLNLHAAAWLLDRIDDGLGALCRMRWSSLLFILAEDVAGNAGSSIVERPSLRKRVQRIRDAARVKVGSGPRS
ncbi:exopolysaccharide biosynthesis protein [Methylocystis parvus]|nr:exopolysaccharide biosynthesis protein [Methylocystis parvus]